MVESVQAQRNVLVEMDGVHLIALDLFVHLHVVHESYVQHLIRVLAFRAILGMTVSYHYVFSNVDMVPALLQIHAHVNLDGLIPIVLPLFAHKRVVTVVIVQHVIHVHVHLCGWEMTAELLFVIKHVSMEVFVQHQTRAHVLLSGHRLTVVNLSVIKVFFERILIRKVTHFQNGVNLLGYNLSHATIRVGAHQRMNLSATNYNDK
jgi:hypothetical protein